MIKLIALSAAQAILAVGGIAMLTRTLHGKTLGIREIFLGLTTYEGLLGLLLLFASFIIMSVILSFAKMAIYIPISTALTFVFTVILALVLGEDKISIPLVVGMMFIVLGVGLVSWAK